MTIVVRVHAKLVRGQPAARKTQMKTESQKPDPTAPLAVARHLKQADTPPKERTILVHDKQIFI